MTSKGKEEPTDDQIAQQIGNALVQPRKASYLVSAVLAMSFLALTLRFAVPTGFRETGGQWALVLWIIGLCWTLVAAFGWKTLSSDELRRLPKEQQRRCLRLGMIWFCCWKGGCLAIVALWMLLIGLGALSDLGPIGVPSGLAVGGCLLTVGLSLWQRRRLLHAMIRRPSADTWWGKFLPRLAVSGPAIGASIGSAIGIALARLRVLPENVLVASIGLVAITAANMILPAVVQDFSVAGIHIRMLGDERGLS